MNSSGERTATPSSFLIEMSPQTRMLSGDVHSKALCAGWKCHLPGQQEAAFTCEYVLGGYLKPTCWVWIKTSLSCWLSKDPISSDRQRGYCSVSGHELWCSPCLPSYRWFL